MIVCTLYLSGSLECVRVCLLLDRRLVSSLVAVCACVCVCLSTDPRLVGATTKANRRNKRKKEALS